MATNSVKVCLYFFYFMSIYPSFFSHWKANLNIKNLLALLAVKVVVRFGVRVKTGLFLSDAELLNLSCLSENL
jgi:hypothetical protein